MDMYPKYKSALGYQVGDNGIDSYGVNHNNFSLRDELEYQMARTNRESQLINRYNQQGINNNYPQQGVGFWGNSAENNYGFGSSNIGGNIENVTNRLNNNGFGNVNNGQGLGRSNMLNYNGYSDYGLLLQPNTLTTQGVQYAQMIMPNTATDYNKSTTRNPQDAIFDRVFNRTLIEEGGYEDRSNRIDTPTNMGIQQSTLNRFRNAHPDLAQGYPENVKNITLPQAQQIARVDYFDKYRIGEIEAEPLQEIMFDSFFNHSPTDPAY